MLRAVDTTDPMATLHAQMEDMIKHDSTRVAFLLASPGNRRSTANGGYDHMMFDRMVRGPTYGALLSNGSAKYEVLNHRRVNSQFAAIVKIVLGNGRERKFEFAMSMQPSSVVDEDARLAPYQLARGHPPCWRTDSVMPSRH